VSYVFLMYMQIQHCDTCKQTIWLSVKSVDCFW